MPVIGATVAEDGAADDDHALAPARGILACAALSAGLWAGLASLAASLW